MFSGCEDWFSASSIPWRTFCPSAAEIPVRGSMTPTVAFCSEHAINTMHTMSMIHFMLPPGAKKKQAFIRICYPERGYKKESYLYINTQEFVWILQFSKN